MKPNRRPAFFFNLFMGLGLAALGAAAHAQDYPNKPIRIVVPFSPADAAMAARDLIKAKTVIPMHYLTNPALPGTPAQFTSALGGSSVKVMVLQPGDTAEF